MLAPKSKAWMLVNATIFLIFIGSLGYLKFRIEGIPHQSSEVEHSNSVDDRADYGRVSRVKNTNDDKFLSVSFDRGTVAFTPQLQKLLGRNYVDVALSRHSYTYYSAMLSIGNPPQNVSVLLDTGSADTWVTDSSSPYCNKKQKSGQTLNCKANGSFNTSLSKSVKNVTDDGKLDLGYADGSSVQGTWITDDIKLGGNVTLKNFQFGLATNVSGFINGVAALGFPAPDTEDPKYSIPQFLKNESYIDVAAFSLYLNSSSASTGSLLFGAVDQSKYSGNLVSFPMVDTNPENTKQPTSLSVTLQKIQVTGKKFKKTAFKSMIPALLDSGTSVMGIPERVLNNIAHNVGATYNKTANIYTLNCTSLFDNTTTIGFDFGDLTIDIPLSDLTLYQGGETCVLAMSPTKDSFILGDSFLTSAYVVFDLDNKLISLAQAVNNLNDTSSTKKNPITKINSDGSIAGAKKAKAKPWTAS